MPEVPRFPDLAHQELYESLLDAFLLAQTSSDFATTFLGAVVPLQQQVSDLSARVSTLESEVADLTARLVVLEGKVP